MRVQISIRFLRIAFMAFLPICASVVFANEFRWNWHEARELFSQESLRTAPIAELDRQLLRKAVASQLRPDTQYPDYPEIASEDLLEKAALDTRVAMIDLDGDGIPEVVAQGSAECSPTGNCPIWIFQKAPKGYRAILKGYGQTFTVQHNRVSGYFEIVIGMHGSATEQELKVYSYKSGRYRKTACFDADWEVLERDQTRELKEPRITPCTRP